MANYGEELAYWYFRLNGFFPITNFVVHQAENNRYNRDCDLVAVRPPYVEERVGGQAHDWHDSIVRAFDLNGRVRHCAVICEVKTGAVGAIFNRQAVSAAVERTGLVHVNTRERAQEDIFQYGSCDNGIYVIKKILVSHDNVQGNHIHIPLREALNFIRGRMATYRNEKNAARHFFNSSLIQFLADQAFD
ncbi:hypothetical protein [Humidesulfovibrio sp.]